MSGDTKRVNFNFPERLVERADVLGEVEERDRAEIVTTAPREYLRDATADERIVQEIAGAYYDDRIDFEELRALVGPERAGNFRILKGRLDEEFLDGVADSMDFERARSSPIPPRSLLRVCRSVRSLGTGPPLRGIRRSGSTGSRRRNRPTRLLRARSSASGTGSQDGTRRWRVISNTEVADSMPPLDAGERAAIALANEEHAGYLLCNEFSNLTLIVSAMDETQPLTTPGLLIALVRREGLPKADARAQLAEIAELRSWERNSFYQRSRRVLDQPE
jgi:hypothetical protein